MKERGCACAQCVLACKVRPGWFKPGEAEKVAERLGKTVEEMIRDKELIEDYWAGGGDEAVVVLRPRKDSDEGDSRSAFGDAFRDGRCAFLSWNDRCSIYPVRPHECRVAFPCKPPDDNLRVEIRDAWIEAGRPLGRPEQDPLSDLMDALDALASVCYNNDA